MKIMVFTEGTLTMPLCGKEVSRDERVEQVKKALPEVGDFSTYIPVGDAVNKLNEWYRRSAEICYLTSRTEPKEIQMVQSTLNKFDFPKGHLYYRENKETYSNVAERVTPDILIEDDCESIGGEVEMTYPHISPEKKKLIKSIVIKEFMGIDNLPNNLVNLVAAS